jgi:carboxyl-terminal processing protease
MFKKTSKFGALKLTIAKFYRINGSSTQLKGVEPDIPFIDAFSFLKIGEKELDNPLPWDTINSSNYKPLQYPYIIDSIKNRSFRRMEKDSFFIYSKRYAEFLKKDFDDKKLPLNLKEYQEYIKTKKSYTKPYNKTKNKKTPVIINYTYTDSELMETDTVMRMRYDKWRKKLKKDHQLWEAYNIMKDMKTFKK